MTEPARRWPGRHVVIFGQRSVQNLLVAGLINEWVGCQCQVRPVHPLHGGVTAPDTIGLLDVDGMSTQDVDSKTRELVASGSYTSIGLLNADAQSIGELVYAPGVRGVFFRDTSRDTFVKGLKAMLSGEYWLPRSLLVAHFEQTRGESGLGRPSVTLTRKETQTLELLAAGHSNTAIARRLGVSPHTVKTHIYNLFPKIGAKNRVQAVNWAAHNLGSLRRVVSIPTPRALA